MKAPHSRGRFSPMPLLLVPELKLPENLLNAVYSAYRQIQEACYTGAGGGREQRLYIQVKLLNYEKAHSSLNSHPFYSDERRSAGSVRLAWRIERIEFLGNR